MSHRLRQPDYKPPTCDCTEGSRSHAFHTLLKIFDDAGLVRGPTTQASNGFYYHRDVLDWHDRLPMKICFKLPDDRDVVIWWNNNAKGYCNSHDNVVYVTPHEAFFGWMASQRTLAHKEQESAARRVADVSFVLCLTRLSNKDIDAQVEKSLDTHKATI